MVKENISEEIASLKNQSGKDIIIIGNIKLAQSLMTLGLIDEYRINVNPIVLGEGIPLFKNISERINLRLEEINKFNSGVTGLVYQVKPNEK